VGFPHVKRYAKSLECFLDFVFLGLLAKKFWSDSFDDYSQC
jgi:hypothetical protein